MEIPQNQSSPETSDGMPDYKDSDYAHSPENETEKNERNIKLSVELRTWIKQNPQAPNINEAVIKLKHLEKEIKDLQLKISKSRPLPHVDKFL